MKRAVVTGGAGFIGSNLIQLLVQANYDIVVVDNLSTGYETNLENLGVELVACDIRDSRRLSGAFEDADVSFHLAASVGNLRSIENPILDSEVNVIGTLNVLEAVRRAEVPKLVVSSSAGIFGELRLLPIDENHPAEPDSPYGASKLASEKLALVYAKLYDMDVVCLRYFNVYGKNQRYDAYGNAIPIFAQRLLQNTPVTIYGDGEQTRDFVNVRDVARANLLAAETNGVIGAFNIASGSAISINELVRLMASGFSDYSIEYGPPRSGDVRHSIANISAARDAFGYAPTVDLSTGLLEYLEWAREHVSESNGHKELNG